MENISIENRKKIFNDLTHLITAMENYECNQSEKNKLKLDFLTITSDNILLPSGKWGNVIALALEMHYFITANYLLENKDELFISLDYVAFELDNTNVIHYEDELEFALSYYDAEKEELTEYKNAIFLERDKATINIFNEKEKAIEKLKNYRRIER